MANWAPMQMRGPAPNGMKANRGGGGWSGMKRAERKAAEVVPQIMVTVQDPGCDHDQGAGRQVDAGGVVMADRFAHDREGGGKQAQGFVDHGFGADQVGDGVHA